MQSGHDLLEDFIGQRLPSLLSAGTINKAQVREALGVIGLMASSLKPDMVLASTFVEARDLVLQHFQRARRPESNAETLRSELFEFLKGLGLANPAVALLMEMIGQAGFAAKTPSTSLVLAPTMASGVIKQAKNLWGEDDSTKET